MESLESVWWIYFAASVCLGCAVGSFLNVVIHRLPLGLSVVRPASRCPGCGTGIKAWQNIPVASWILLGGKCAECRQPISVRYPLVEALMGALAAGLFYRFGPTPAFGFYFLFLAGIVTATFIDLDHRIIPDSVSLGGIPLGFAGSFFNGVGWVDSLIGITAGGGSLLAVAGSYYLVTKREGMGMGDVKLLACIGAFLGWKGIIFTLLVSSVTGALVGLVLMLLTNSNSKLEIPFGPYLAAGATAYLLHGPELIDWYLGGFPG